MKASPGKVSKSDKESNEEGPFHEMNLRVKVSRPIRGSEIRKSADTQQTRSKPSMSRIEMVPFHRNCSPSQKKKSHLPRMSSCPSRTSSATTLQTLANFEPETSTHLVSAHPAQKDDTFQNCTKTLNRPATPPPMKSLLDNDVPGTKNGTTDDDNDFGSQLMNFVTMITNAIGIEACMPVAAELQQSRSASEIDHRGSSKSQVVTFGRSASLPSLYENEGNGGAIEFLLPSVRSMHAESLLPVITEEGKEEGNVAVQNPSLHVSSFDFSTVNFGNALSFDSSKSLWSNMSGGRPIEQTQSTQAIEELPTTQPAEHRQPPKQVPETEKREGSPVERKPNQSRQRPTNRQAAAERQLDARDIRQVTDLVKDLTRETAQRDVCLQPLRLVRISSSRRDSWRRRLMLSKK